MTMKSMGYLFGHKGKGITSDEEGLGEVGSGGNQGSYRFTTPRQPKKRGWSTQWTKGIILRNGGFVGDWWILVDGGVDMTLIQAYIDVQKLELRMALSSNIHVFLMSYIT